VAYLGILEDYDSALQIVAKSSDRMKKERDGWNFADQVIGAEPYV
jgi:hypothetical protein